MSITKAQAASFITESLGGTPESLDVIQIINMAGVSLVNMREWLWCKRTAVALDLVEDQAYIDLPTDLLIFESVDSATRGQIVQLVTRNQFLLWLRGEYGTPPGYVASVSAESVSNVMRYRMNIYPVPSADVTGAMYLSYTAGWTALASDAGDSVVLELPAFLEPLFFEVLLAVAKGAEKHDMANISPRLSQIEGGSIFQNAARIDASVQPVVGVIPTGGRVARRANSMRLY